MMMWNVGCVWWGSEEGKSTSELVMGGDWPIGRGFIKWTAIGLSTFRFNQFTISVPIPFFNLKGSQKYSSVLLISHK
jgi:hypothetical protein